MIRDYTEFWDFYIREHSRPMTRLIHFAGTLASLSLLIQVLLTGRWYFFPICFAVGYAFAWFSHFVIEKNRPATFKYPLWSFISDLKMFWYMLSGQMEREVRRVLGEN